MKGVRLLILSIVWLLSVAATPHVYDAQLRSEVTVTWDRDTTVDYYETKLVSQRTPTIEIMLPTTNSNEITFTAPNSKAGIYDVCVRACREYTNECSTFTCASLEGVDANKVLQPWVIRFKLPPPSDVKISPPSDVIIE